MLCLLLNVLKNRKVKIKGIQKSSKYQHLERGFRSATYPSIFRARQRLTLKNEDVCSHRRSKKTAQTAMVQHASAVLKLKQT